MAMTKLSRFLQLALATTFVFAIGPGLWAVEQSVPRKEGKFWVLETRHYVIKTDVSEPFAKELGEQMESCYNAYMKYTRGTPKFQGKSTVVVYKRRADFLKRYSGPRGEHAAAFYSPATKELVSFLEKNTEEEIFRYLRHEGLHQFMDKWVGDTAPPWVNEGLAYFYTYCFKEGNEFRLGVVTRYDVNLLKQAFAGEKVNFISLRDLMLMDWERWAQNEARYPMKAEVQSLEARLLVQFLLMGGKKSYTRMLDNFLMACSKGIDPEQGLKSAFGANISSLSKAWMDYLKQLKPTFPESCTINLEYLASLLQVFSKYHKNIDSPEALLNIVKSNKDVKWWIREIGGGPEDKITQNDLDVVEKWFRCPKEKNSERATSYEFVKSESKAGFPDIICRNHAPVALRAVILPGEEEGKYRTVVREEPLKKRP
jgi:hypothetical protein